MVGSGEKNSEQSFEDGLQFECINFLFNVLKLTRSLVLDLYDVQGALSHLGVRTSCPLPAS
jgi:hypothetical protein